ncbi:LacI family DNA-binding transcriptional regulator [Streptomyces sp. M19]
MVGIKDVARQAGVSVGTVSNVINRPEMVSEATRDRVLSTIERLGYVRSESARQLRAGRSRIISCWCWTWRTRSSWTSPAARSAAREAGLGVMVCNSAQSPREEAEYLALFAEHRVRGVLVTPADSTGRNLASFRRNDIPFVFVDREVPSAEGVRSRSTTSRAARWRAVTCSPRATARWST